MIDAIIRWSLSNRAIVLAAAVALVVIGIMQVARMPVDVFPDLTAPTVTVVAEAHAMAPEEVERLVTFELEVALKGASGVRRVRSATSVGVAVIWVEFEWGTDRYRARQLVSERLRRAQAALPPDVEPPQLAPMSSLMGEVMFIGLTSDRHTATELRAIADWDVRRRLMALQGVSQVVPIGGGVKQLQVMARPADLQKHNVTLDELGEAVAASNQNTSAGFYEKSGQEYVIYGLGRVRGAPDVEQAVVRPRSSRSRHGAEPPIRVSDVATVKIGAGIQRGDAAVNNEPAIVLGIQRQADINTLRLTSRLDEAFDGIEASLPVGVKLHRHVWRQADFIETALTNVSHALRDGAILVVLIIGFFLLSGRATVITALAIPLSLVVAVLVLDWMGASLNTMTLGGMAIAVGALVDDAIIDVENVVRRLRQQRLADAARGNGPDKPDQGRAVATSSVVEIVFAASKEIRGSIVFATLIITLVFVPLFFLSGVEGRLLEPLGVAYVVSLMASLVVALTVTPVLCALLLPSSRLVSRGVEPFLVRWLRAGYEPLLRRAIAVWPILVALSVVGIGIAGYAASQAGRTFLPAFNEGALTVSIVAAPGTSLALSNELGSQVEAIIASHPEVISTARRTGRAEFAEHGQGINATEIEVALKTSDRSDVEFLAALRADLSAVNGVNIVVGQPLSHRIDHMISGTRSSIAIKIFGTDLAELRRLAEQVERTIEPIDGVVDLATEQQANLPILTIRFDREALVDYGVRLGDVSETIETAFYGREVSRVIEGSYAYDLVVRYDDNARQDLDTIKATMIPTPAGAWVPLSALADVRRERGPNQISREDGQRKIVVSCNIGDGRDLGSVVDEIRRRLQTVEPPAGYFVQLGGQFEAAEEAARTLLVLSILVILGVFLLLLAALNSARDASLVMLNLPLALIGGVYGVYADNAVISIASLIGFITLFGIATRNGIMLVTHIRHLRDHEGVTNPYDAVVQGASERLAPILMTALASGLGLVPLALAGGEAGSELQAPMAMVILYGLVTSTVLNMFVVPAVMLRFGSIRVRGAARPAA